MQDEDRRNFSRVNFDALVKVDQGDQSVDVQLIDLSLDGLLIKTPNVYSFDTNEPLQIKIYLSDEAVIKMHVELRHCSSDFLGLKCTSIDIESMTYLRRVIENNIAVPNASQRVLSELINRGKHLN